MSIWSTLFGKPPEQKPYTVKLVFKSLNGAIQKLTHNNVIASKMWFRVLAHTPDQQPITAIHIIEFADGNQLMYRDDESQKLIEFRTEV